MPTTTFASGEDLVARLGRALTATETTSAELLLELATGAIADACDQDAAWAPTVDPVPSILRIVCLEAVVRVMSNPSGLRSEQESLGAHSRSVSYATASEAGLELTDRETLLVRRQVLGRLSGSSTPASNASEVHDLYYAEDDEA